MSKNKALISHRSTFSNQGSPRPSFRNSLKNLEFSGSIMSRIGNTRALDGTQTAESEIASASWTYHPDDGLSLVVELK